METISESLALCRGNPGHRWIPLTKASDAELRWFLLSTPKQTVEQWNNRDGGDLRRHRAYYDVKGMYAGDFVVLCLGLVE